MSVQLQAQWQEPRHPYRHIKATWEGGAYIDLRFGMDAQWGDTPTEVINVWDYEHDRPQVPFTQPMLASVLREWVQDMDDEARDWAIAHDEEVNDWYQQYLDNR